MQIANLNAKATMTSFELYKLINNCRENAGESKVRPNDFNARIADELEGDHYETFVVKNPNKTETIAFRLTIEQWFNVVCDVKNGHEFTQCLVTPAGQIKIAELWAKRAA